MEHPFDNTGNVRNGNLIQSMERVMINLAVYTSSAHNYYY